MANAIVYDKDRALREGITQAGSAFGNAFRFNAMQEAEEKKRQQILQEQSQLKQNELQNQAQYGTILSETLSNLTENSSPMDIVTSMTDMMNKGVPVEYLKSVMPLIAPQLKSASQGNQQRSFLEQMGLLPQVGIEEEATRAGQFSPIMEGIEPSNFSSPMSSSINPMGMDQSVPIPTPVGKPLPQQPSRLESLSETQLIAMQGSGIPQAKAIAEGEMKRREMNQKNFRSDRDFAYKKSSKFFDKLEEEADRVGDQREALRNMENAIKEGNTEFWSKDNFANFLGKYGEGLRTAKGAQLLNAQKEFLVADIGRVGNRPNQWIEQQISSALTKIGRSEEANLTITSALNARVERAEAKQEIARNLENYYLEKDGTIPANFTNIVRETMKPVETQIQDKLSYKIRQYYEQENSGKLRSMMSKKVSPGTPLTIQMASLFLEKYGDKEKAIKTAKQLGYTIPSPDEYRRFIK